jgi:two-component system NtrC family response regulator
VAPLNLKAVRETAETIAIKRALSQTKNNIASTARLLGVARPTLYTLLSKYSIEVDDI